MRVQLQYSTGCSRHPYQWKLGLHAEQKRAVRLHGDTRHRWLTKNQCNFGMCALDINSAWAVLNVFPSIGNKLNQTFEPGFYLLLHSMPMDINIRDFHIVLFEEGYYFVITSGLCENYLMCTSNGRENNSTNSDPYWPRQSSSKLSLSPYLIESF